MAPSYRIHIYRFLTLAALLSVLLLPTQAFCRLSLEAELDYVNYDVRNNSNQHLSANSLTQRYSLLYQTEGKLVNGRLGKYNLSLGYDWSTFDTTIKSTSGAENPQGSRGHILYRGEILIDPRELPFRFSAYSRDLSRTTFTQDGSTLSGSVGGSALIGAPQLVSGVMSGMHIDSGATLVMGVKNGMTNGYNEILRHFPMLMLDYRDQINQDLHSTSPVNDRLSRLAFVSLNKKDNWFHYRTTTYDDYINTGNSYKETQIQLGTVDQALQRRWIDFANWIQISADGQLTQRRSGSNNSSTSSTSNFSEFDLNLFGIARRSSWEARTFNNFNRRKDEDGRIAYRTAVPVYVNGSLNADTSWSTYLAFKEDHDNRANSFSDFTGGYRIDTLKRSPFTLSQQLDLERATSNTSDISVASAALETTSTTRFSRIVNLAAGYNVRYYSYGGTANTSNFIDQSLRLNATYTPSNQTRLSLNQTSRLTSGTSQYVSSDLPGAAVGSPQYVDPRNNQGTNGSSFQSITALAVSWNPLARLYFGLTATEDIYIPQDRPHSYRTQITQTTDYSGPNLKLSTANTFSYDNSPSTTTSTNALSSRNRADYIFSRNIDSHVSITYSKAFDNSTQSDILSVEQGLNYYHYRVNGITRKLFEINESVDYTEGNSAGTNSIVNTPVFITPVANVISNTNRSKTTNLTLGFKYYPIRQLVLAAGSRYSFFNSFNDNALTYYGSISLNYRLLQASLDYIYGTSRADGRVEKKVTANVKKLF